MSRHVQNCYTVDRPCRQCGHNVSRYRWEFLGLRVCWGCEEDTPATGHVMRIHTAATDAVHVADRRRKRRTRTELD